MNALTRIEARRVEANRVQTLAIQGHDDEDHNTSRNPSLNDIIDARLSRRGLFRASTALPIGPASTDARFLLIYNIRDHSSSSFIMRTIVDLEDAQVNRLDLWAKAEKVSRAEAVRRAVNQMLERASAPQGTGFGLWAQNSVLGSSVPPERDGLVLQRAMRDEWPD